MASTRDVSIEADTIPSAAFTGDEDLVRRMIVNLIDNAVRHAPAGSTVRVDLDDDATTGYAIADQGPGAGHSAEIRPHIFERFYRRRSPRADSIGTTGPGSAWRWRAGSPTSTAATWCWRARLSLVRPS